MGRPGAPSVPASAKADRVASLIVALHSGFHDSSAALFDNYRVIAAVQRERLTRRKNDNGLPLDCLEEVLRIGNVDRSEVRHVVFTRTLLPRQYFRIGALKRLREKVRARRGIEKFWYLADQLRKRPGATAGDLIDGRGLLAHFGLPTDAGLSFCNHHYAHALPSLFFTDWPEALLYTADGAGDNVNYSHYHFDGRRIVNLFGDDRWLNRPMRIDSLGRAYSVATESLGFRPFRHEGKVTGLAAFGRPTLAPQIASHFHVDEEGRIDSDFPSLDDMADCLGGLFRGAPREEVAASIQNVLEETVLDSVRRLLARTGARHLGLAGGVFANVRLNQRLAEELPVDEVFVVPPMGDEGLVIGGVLQHLLERDGLERWLAQRHRLDSIYWGRDYDAEVDAALRDTPGIKPVPGAPIETAARLLADHRIVAIYTGRMEYGPRALGARSILANPAERDINRELNARLERTEFMPFAPVCTEEDAAEVFRISPVNRYACRFMTITCGVAEHWRDRIPAVVHVDNTARPQIVARDANPLYYGIIREFKKLTGLPVLVNTSFNAHEEPIIDSPAQAAAALTNKRIDYLVTEKAVYQAPA
jgi:carbamoyltransferase